MEMLLISELLLLVDVAESAWNLEIEDKLVKDLEATPRGLAQSLGDS